MVSRRRVRAKPYSGRTVPSRSPKELLRPHSAVNWEAAPRTPRSHCMRPRIELAYQNGAATDPNRARIERIRRALSGVASQERITRRAAQPRSIPRVARNGQSCTYRRSVGMEAEPYSLPALTVATGRSKRRPRRVAPWASVKVKFPSSSAKTAISASAPTRSVPS